MGIKKSFDLQLLAALNSPCGRRNEGYIFKVLATEATGQHVTG